MADKTVADLPALQSLTDDTLIPVYQPGAADPAQKMKGQIFRQWAEACVTPYSNSAQSDAILAEAARSAAQNASAEALSALSGVQNAIKNIPAGATPIVNDLTTGGAKMALSAEMGKKLLPLDGSKSMTGNIVVSKATPLVRLDDTAKGSSAMLAEANNQLLIQNIDVTGNDSNRRQIILRNASHETSPALADALLLNTVIESKQVAYRLFGQHNKPSGSYTGNGSAAARTIDVGGIGKFVAVYSNNAGTSPALIVTPLGAFGKNSSGVKALGYNDVRFADGVLTVASADNDVNANGKTYYYQVL